MTATARLVQSHRSVAHATAAGIAPAVTISPRTETLVVFVLAFAWRLGAAVLVPEFALDEAIFGLATIDDVLAGGFPLHYVNAPYGLPLIEWIAAPVFALLGPNPLWLRLPSILLASAGIAWLFAQLRTQVPANWARIAAVLVACPHGLHLTFVSLSSTYGVGLLAIAAANRVMAATRLTSPVRKYAVTGLQLGLLHFIFPQIRLVILAWATFRLAPHVARTARRLWAHRQTRLVLVCASVGGLFLGAAAYHFLTRRENYVFTSAMTAAWLLGVALFIPAAGVVVFRLRSWRGVVRRFALAGGCFLLGSLPLEGVYAKWQKERLERGDVHDPTGYSLKHAHAWPKQVSCFISRTVPFAVGRDSADLTNWQAEETPSEPGWFAFGTAVVVVWSVGAFTMYRTARSVDGRRWILWWLWPVALMAAIMIPSWHLAVDLHARYFTLVAFGLWLPVAFGLAGLRSTALRWTAVALILGWNAWDAFVVWPRYWTPG